MSKKCPWCKVNVYLTELKHWYKCPECQTEFPERAFPKEITLFDRITASPEVLAKKLVNKTAIRTSETVYDHRGRGIGVKYYIEEVWKSTITEDTYISETEAIAATLARLKEVAE